MNPTDTLFDYFNSLTELYFDEFLEKLGDYSPEYTELDKSFVKNIQTITKNELIKQIHYLYNDYMSKIELGNIFDDKSIFKSTTNCSHNFFCNKDYWKLYPLFICFNTFVISINKTEEKNDNKRSNYYNEGFSELNIRYYMLLLYKYENIKIKFIKKQLSKFLIKDLGNIIFKYQI